MPFERSRFGDGSVAGAGNVITTVANHFGQRGRLDEESQGIIDTDGALNELVIDIDAATVTAAAFVLQAQALPIKARIIRVLWETRDVFNLGGTTPSIRIGTAGSVAANGVAVSEAQAEAVGLYDITAALSGTWLNQLAARTVLGLALAGTGPTNGTVGRGRMVIQYAKVS
jgi:hypothetical protein